MQKNAEQIISALESAGFHARFLPISAMEQIKEHYDTMLERGPDTQWLRNGVGHFRRHQPPKLDFEPQSFLVIACQGYQGGRGGKVVLRQKGQTIEIPIGPFCPDGQYPEDRLPELLAELTRGWQLGHTAGISQKLLAALSGLGQYGRNNICFVGEYGSYVGLQAHYTDIPYEGPVCAELRMAACETCDLCRKACPTGAIGETQVIDAGRCISVKNEVRGRIPRWIPKTAHHTLNGCLRCQECCPQNPPVDHNCHVLALDEAETKRLLSRGKKMPKTVEKKFRDFGIGWDMQVVKRNAKLAVKAKQST